MPSPRLRGRGGRPVAGEGKPDRGRDQGVLGSASSLSRPRPGPCAPRPALVSVPAVRVTGRRVGCRHTNIGHAGGAGKSGGKPVVARSPDRATRATAGLPPFWRPTVGTVARSGDR